MLRTTIAAFAAVAAFGCDGASIVVDGGSEPPENPATPQEAYVGQYEKFMVRNVKLAESLFTAGQEPNLVAARVYAKDCVDAITAMHKLLKEPQATEFALVVANYRNVFDGLQRNKIYVSRFQLDVWSRDVARFAPSKLEWAKAWAPAQSSASPPPLQPFAPEPPRAPPASLMIAFKAWQQLHSDLESAWIKGEDAQATFDHLMEVLALLQGAVPREKLVKLNTYIEFYKDVQQETNGFKQPPRGATKEDVSNQLKAVASGIMLNFNPDRSPR